MISVKKLLKPFLEASYVELEKMSDAGRQERSLGLLSEYVGIDQGQDGHARTFWKVHSDSKPGKKYTCVVEFHVPAQGGLFGIAKSKWDLKTFHKALSTADVKVHCSCPDFYWSGMKYNLGPNGKHKGTLSPNQNAGYPGEPNVVGNNLKPDKRDPNREHVLCKHLINVKDAVKLYATTFMRDIKNFDTNIKVNDEVGETLDDGSAVLGKDIELSGVSDKDASEFMEPIIHAPEPKPSEVEDNKENAEEIISNESEPAIEEPKEDTVDELIDEEYETPIAELPDEVDDVIEEESDIPEPSKGAEDIIEDKNVAAKAELEQDVPEQEDENILEKDKKNSNVPDPDEVLEKE